MHELSHTYDYYLDEDDLIKMIKRPDFNKRKEADKDFYSSKVSYYEFHPSQFGLEYILSPKIKIDKFENDLTAALGKKGIRAKYTYFKFDKEKIDKSGDDIIAKSRPFRVNSKGEVKALFLSPLDKSDCVEYLRNKLGIAQNEVLAAGDEGNDYPIAKLTENGSFFVCVANATKDFRRLVLNIKDKKRNTLILAKNEGAAGIVEGIEKVLAKFRLDLD
jgi:hydroxymethylpyrimidine pyrophosphatase-like HAD family hydrolase